MNDRQRALREANAALAGQAKKDERFDGPGLELVQDAKSGLWFSVPANVLLTLAFVVVVAVGFSWLVR